VGCKVGLIVGLNVGHTVGSLLISATADSVCVVYENKTLPSPLTTGQELIDDGGLYVHNWEPAYVTAVMPL
jgi:hypothetical protein